MITIYSLPNCGNCKMLKKILEDKNISFNKIEDKEIIIENGITTIPTLELEDGTRLAFGDAYRWIQAQGENN